MADEELAKSLRARGIHDEGVLRAIAVLERRHFVPPECRPEALGDYPLPIGFGQTISQPFICAYMTQALRLKGDERVLEIGTGSGYQTALLAPLTREVYSIEINSHLAHAAEARLAALGLTNVHLRLGDGHIGWPDAAPFDAIVLTAAPERIPEALIAQLARRGRMIAPVGATFEAQELIRLEKLDDGTVRTESLLPVRFVTMTGGATALPPEQRRN